MTESTETTELSAGEQTRQRVLGIAVRLARRDGIEAVTHKTVAAIAELSSSNVSYYFGKATDLRRAVAVEIVRVAADDPTLWFEIEVFVDDGLAFSESVPELPDGTIALAEAYVWLARNGVTG